jgi:hypothetical protein
MSRRVSLSANRSYGVLPYPRRPPHSIFTRVLPKRWPDHIRRQSLD